jgi:hypothetical protein
MKKITLILMAFMATTALWQVQAQGEILQAAGSYAACSDFQDGDIYADTGGIAADYQNNEFSVMELVAPAGETLTVEFTTFSVEAGWDSLTVTGDTGGFDGAYDGTTNPPTMTSGVGAGLTFEFDSDSSGQRPGWTANLSVSNCPPPPPVANFEFCSTEMPLNFAPPVQASASNAVSSTANSGDTGVIGAGLGEYAITSMVINAMAGSAQDVAFDVQSPSGTIMTLLNGGSGGADGLLVAADLVFTDSSSNDISNWLGGAPLADYLPAFDTFASAFSGEDINGDWYILADSNPGNQAGGTVNSFCINFEMQTGTPPVISCIPDFTANNDEGVCGAVVNYTPATAIDGDTGEALPVVLTGGGATGTEFAVGDNEVTFTATNAYGSQSSCTFIISVLDNEAPMAVCADYTVTLDASGNGSLVAADLDGGSTDNCAVTDLTASQTAFTCANVGSVTVTLTVSDDAGNTSTCEANVTVVDDIAPMITCVGQPGNVTLTEDFEGSSLPTGWSNEMVVGNWDWTFGSPDMPNSDPFASNAAIFNDDAAGAGETNIASLTSPAYDASGTVDSMTLSYDYSLDELGAGEVLIVSVWDGSAWAQVALYDTDAIPPTNSGDMDILAYANADFAVRFTYDDAGSWGWGAGIDNVVVNIQTPSAPPLELNLNADGTLSYPAADLISVVDEACDYTVASGTSGPCDFNNPNDFTFENGYNCSSASAFQTANDLIVPADGEFTLNQIKASIFANGGIASVDVVYYDDAAGLPGAVIGQELGMTPTSSTVIGANFGFDVNEIVLDVAPMVFAGQPGAPTTYWIELNVTDGGATGSVFWVVTSSSSIGQPVANFNGGWVLPDPAMDGVMTLVGVCGGGGADFSFDCSNLGLNEVEVYVTDAAGNTSSCIASVIINDVTAPVIVCGPGDGATTVTEGFDGSSLPTGWSNEMVVGNWDWTFGSPDMPNSDPFASNAAIFNDDAAGAGETNIASLTSPSYDLSGDVASATLSYDYSLDELGAGEVLIVSAWDGSAWAQVALYDADVIPPTNSGAMDVLAYANADFAVRFTYDDAGSWGWGAGVDNFELTYAIPPTTSEVIVTLDENGEATVDPYGFLSESFDACGISVIVADREFFSCDDIGTPILVTVFASDASGNSSSCSVEVLVVDTMAPVLTCPEDQETMVDPDGTHVVADYIADGLATATDNCTDPVTDFTQDPAPGTVYGVGTWPITFTATDEYGNVSTCTMELDLTILGTQDNELNNAIALYPNPANEQVTISNSSNITLETAMIYDLNGKLVSQINLQNMQSEKVIDVSAYATGVYMVYITGEQSSVVKRLIKE